MYDELVKRLRDSEHEIDCSLCDRNCCYQDGKVHGKCIIIEASDAIEELNNHVEELKRDNKELEECAESVANTLRDHDEMLHAYRHVCNGLSPDEVKKKLFYQELATAHILEQLTPFFTTKWISVKGIEPLPKDGEKVLVFAQWENSEPIMDVAMFSLYEGTSDYGWKSEASNFWYSSDEVTHWMPLPEPPREET